ncbi:MAG: lysozyme [Ruminococcaceae bacterium]|nr:lysozyme [Oscillospiraceae bacterium]
MDIKEKISKIVDKVKNDPEIAELFKKDPIKAVEKVIGVDLPDDVIDKVVDGVKAKIGVESAGDALGKLKKLF